MITMRKQHWHFLFFTLLFAVQIAHALSSLSRNDPYPVYTALDPQEFLLTHQKLLIRDPEFANKRSSNASISISPFGQNADRGRDIDGIRAALAFLIFYFTFRCTNRTCAFIIVA